MALLFSTAARAPFTFSQSPKPSSLSPLQFRISLSTRSPRFPSLRFISAAGDTGDADKPSAKISDEWGEDSEPEPEASSSSKLPDSDPPKNEDEWGGVEADAGEYIDAGNGTPATATEAPEEDEVDEVDENLERQKRALVDTVYGTELGFRAGSEIRAEVSELVTQLEVANPTPAPVEAPALLNGNWVLL